jgi:hypothetical protein
MMIPILMRISVMALWKIRLVPNYNWKLKSNWSLKSVRLRQDLITL